MLRFERSTYRDVRLPGKDEVTTRASSRIDLFHDPGVDLERGPVAVDKFYGAISLINGEELSVDIFNAVLALVAFNRTK